MVINVFTKVSLTQVPGSRESHVSPEKQMENIVNKHKIIRFIFQDCTVLSLSILSNFFYAWESSDQSNLSKVSHFHLYQTINNNFTLIKLHLNSYRALKVKV